MKAAKSEYVPALGFHWLTPYYDAVVGITTPAAIVQQGTTHQQRVLTGALATLPDLTASANLTPPTLIIVGEVVSLHRKLAWFEPQRDLYADAPDAKSAG